MQQTVEVRKLYPWAILPGKRHIERAEAREEAQLLADHFRYHRQFRRAEACPPWVMGQELGWVLCSPVTVELSQLDDVQLAGPSLASVLMLGLGPDIALFTVIGAVIAGSCLTLMSRQVRSALRPKPGTTAKPQTAPQAGGRARRFARTLAGPIASRELQRIVLPLILMGSVFGVVGILAPALCARSGHGDATGFVLAAISLGGVIGALIYNAAKMTWPLRTRHAVLGLVFGLPLLFGFAADSPWTLGVLLALGGLAVTPLYINAYLMMDDEIPPEVIHEANTWVPVGNNVGYVLGITLAASVLGRANVQAALAAVTVFAAVLVAYSALQLAFARRAAVQAPVEA